MNDDENRNDDLYKKSQNDTAITKEQMKMKTI